MKTYSAVFLVLLTVFAAGFGAYLMNHSMDDSHSGCLPGILEGVRCETAINAVEAAILHIRALSQPALAGTMLALFFLAYAILSSFPHPKIARIACRYPLMREWRVRAFAPLRDWLILHEKRDPSFIAP